MAQVTVEQGRVAVVRRDARVVAVLRPGRHRLPWPYWRRRVDWVDVRERVLVVTGQEVAAADLPGVRVSAVARWTVSDPVAWLDVAIEPAEQLRLAVQLAVRDWAAVTEAATLQATRDAAGDPMTVQTTSAVAHLGIAVTEVSVRDVMLPGELRRAVLSVVTARQEGLARLEQARGETAALRALANGARVLEAHPVLARQRLAETAAHSGGTVVLRVGDTPDSAGAEAAPPG